MSHCIEDAIENLAGAVPRLINLRLDPVDKNLFKSLTKQFANGLALTDRQLELCLKKIEKYRGGLERNAIDVDHLLNNKPLRRPLREIDRSKFIKIEKSSEDGKYRIFIKTDNSKKIQEIWNDMKSNLVGIKKDIGTIKEIQLNEQNILVLTEYLSSEGFEISDEITKIREKMEFILENPKNFAPYMDLENGKIVLKNTSKHCQAYFDKVFDGREHVGLVEQIKEAKKCGILQKSNELSVIVNDLEIDEYSRTILKSADTRFRLDPATINPEKIVKILKELNQWPALIILDEDQHVFSRLKSFYSALQTAVNNDEITVFFRLSNGDSNFQEFNQFVRDNHLNNYIDNKTKVVFISKNRIPKPLFNADWSPETAVLVSSHDYGKLSSYLNDLSSVYYYNNSMAVRTNRIKGARQIVQL